MMPKWQNVKRKLISGVLAASMFASMLPAVTIGAGAAYEENTAGKMQLSTDVFKFSSYSQIGTPNPYSIENGNKIILGTPNYQWDQQPGNTYKGELVMAVSKYAITFDQSFELRGTFNPRQMPQGFAITFQPDPNYETITGDNPSHFGIYGKAQSALVVEVDTWGHESAGSLGDNNVTGSGPQGTHLGINTTNYDTSTGQTTTNILQTTSAGGNLLVDQEMDFRLVWDAEKGVISLTCGNYNVYTSFDPESFWGGWPVYFTVSAGLYQAGYDSNRVCGTFDLTIDSFNYSFVQPGESVQYIVHRGGVDSAATNVIYNSGNMNTWPMPGDTVDAVHTLWNQKNNIAAPMNMAVYVPVATVNGNAVTPTGLSGTTGNTNIFNETKNGAAISTATFTFPQTNLTERNAEMKYTYVLPSGLSVNASSKIDDVLVVGAPFMTQYTYVDEVKLAAKPTLTGVENMQVAVGYNGGTFDLKSGMSATAFDGTNVTDQVVIKGENGQEITELSTADAGTYKVYYTAKDNSTKAQTLTTTKLIGELMEAAGTKTGAVSTVGIHEKDNDTGYKTGVVKNYTFEFAVGSASDPDNYAVRDVILKVVSDDASVASDWTSYVDGKDGDIPDATAKKLTDKKDLAKYLSFEGADTKGAKLNELTAENTDSFDVIVSDADWAAIQAGTLGAYQVTLKVGTAEKTVTLTVRYSKPVANEDGSITVPGKDSMVGTEDDVKLVPDPAPMTQEQLEDMIQSNGSVMVDKPASGGTVTLPGDDGKTGTEDDKVVKVEGPFTLKPDGTIVLPEGSTGTITNPDGSETPVTGPAVIDPDGNVDTNVSSDANVADDGTITLPGMDKVTGTDDDPIVNANGVTDKTGAEDLIQTDGSVKLPEAGGTVKLPGEDGKMGTEDDVTANITGPATVKPDGTIVLPDGTTGTVTNPDGSETPVTGPAVINPDGSVNTDVTDKPEVDGGDNTDPDGKKDGSIMLPGKDGVTGTDDDVKVVPDPAPMTQEQLENMVQKDGSVIVDSPATGGTVTLPGDDGKTGTDDDKEIKIEGPFTVKPDGTIVLPEGSTADTDGDGQPDVEGPAVINPDGSVNTDVSSGPSVADDGTITLPGKDKVTGTDDDPTVKADGVDTKEDAEKLIQPDGSVELPEAGGVVNLPGEDGKMGTDDDVKVDITGPATVKPDGTIILPEGSTADMDGDGQPDVEGPAVIYPDGSTNKDVVDKPVVDGSDNTDPDGKKDGSITLPGKDGMTGTDDDVKVVPAPAPMTEWELENMIQPNGSVKVDTPATGGTVTLPGKDGKTGNEDDLKVTVEGSFTVKPDGTIVLPEGSTAEITKPDGSKETVTGPAVIDPDGNVNTDVSSGPEVDGSDNTDPNGKKDGSITLPGRDEVVGTGDDVTVIPAPAPMTQEQLENMIQPDGSVKVETPATGGTVKLPGDDGTNGTKDDKTVNITGPFTVMPDGTIILPEGSNGEIVDEDGNKTPVTGPVIITPEGKPAKPIPNPDGGDDAVLIGDKVQLDPNGGTFPNDLGSAPITVTVDENTNFANYQPTRSGYTFKGWEKVKAPAGVDVAYRAVWQSVGGGGGSSSYTLSFETNGGSKINNVYGSYGTVVKLNKYVPTKDGYTFAGWYTDKALTEKVTEVTLKQSMTVYAKWTEDLNLSDPTVNGVSDMLNTKDHILYLVGYEDGTFKPERSMTRAEVAQMFYRLLLNQNVTITTSFTDVPANAWYAKAVNTLASLGIIEGYGNGEFGPNDPITRAEFTAMAIRFTKLDIASVEGHNQFEDVSSQDWYCGYVVSATLCGWIDGYGNGNFGPKDQITRAQVATIVNRMLGRSADKEFVDANAASLEQFSDLNNGHWAYYQIMEATNAHDYTKNNGVEDWTGLK